MSEMFVVSGFWSDFPVIFLDKEVKSTEIDRSISQAVRNSDKI